MDFSAALQRRYGGAARSTGQLVPVMQNRTGKRAGYRRPLRTLHDGSQPALPGPMVFQDHKLCAALAGQPGVDRLAGLDEAATTQLDRPLGGRRHRFSGRRPPR